MRADETLPADNEPLQIGQRIHCILYGGKTGVIYAIQGEQSPSTTQNLHGVATMGGSANFDIVWDDGSQWQYIAESLARRSVQWRLLPGIAAPGEIAGLLENCERIRKESEIKELAAKRHFAEEQTRLVKEHPYLNVVKDGIHASAKFCAANLRIELKRAFPEVKFSVTSGGSLGVRWVDGPPAGEVGKLTSKYKSGHFNAMQDIYEYSGSPWGATFGDTEYISVERSYSPELLDKMVEYLYLAIPENMCDIPRASGAEMKGSRLMVPDIDVYVSDCIGTLAQAWDCLKDDFLPIDTISGRNKWLIERAIKARNRANEDGDASAPAM